MRIVDEAGAHATQLFDVGLTHASSAQDAFERFTAATGRRVPTEETAGNDGNLLVRLDDASDRRFHAEALEIAAHVFVHVGPCLHRAQVVARVRLRKVVQRLDAAGVDTRAYFVAFVACRDGRGHAVLPTRGHRGTPYRTLPRCPRLRQGTKVRNGCGGTLQG